MSLQSLIAPVAAAAAEDIRDIRAPLPIADAWPWAVAIAALAAVVVGIVLLVRYVRKRRSRALTPRERALAALDKAEKLAREGRSREWAEVVAEATRAALSTRLGAEVLPQTTSEIARMWDPPPFADAPLVLELLDTCDLARFARASLDDCALLAQTTSARQLIEHVFDAPPPTSHDATVAP